MQKVFEESVSSFKEGTPQNQGDQVLLNFLTWPNREGGGGRNGKMP